VCISCLAHRDNRQRKRQLTVPFQRSIWLDRRAGHDCDRGVTLVREELPLPYAVAWSLRILVRPRGEALVEVFARSEQLESGAPELFVGRRQAALARALRGSSRSSTGAELGSRSLRRRLAIGVPAPARHFPDDRRHRCRLGGSAPLGARDEIRFQHPCRLRWRALARIETTKAWRSGCVSATATTLSRPRGSRLRMLLFPP